MVVLQVAVPSSALAKIAIWSILLVTFLVCGYFLIINITIFQSKKDPRPEKSNANVKVAKN